MSSMSVADQIGNFISVVNALGVGDVPLFLHVDSALGRVCHVDAEKLPSSLAAINKLVSSIVSQDLSQIPLRTCQLFRRSFSYVIDNYRSFKNEPYDESEQILAKIPSVGKVSFAGVAKGMYNIYKPAASEIISKPATLRLAERNATEYNPKLLSVSPLQDVENDPMLSILMIQNTISKKFFHPCDYNGKYVIAMIGDALSAAEVELLSGRDSEIDDWAHFCWEWIQESLDMINGSKDLVDSLHFSELLERGWIANTSENCALYQEIGKTWDDAEERKAKVRFPKEYEEKFEEIFCDETIEASINKYFANLAEPCCSEVD